jgi:hypothetical protein
VQAQMLTREGKHSSKDSAWDMRIMHTDRMKPALDPAAFVFWCHLHGHLPHLLLRELYQRRASLRFALLTELLVCLIRCHLPPAC